VVLQSFIATSANLIHFQVSTDDLLLLLFIVILSNLNCATAVINYLVDVLNSTPN